jgi:hypothetical protein
MAIILTTAETVVFFERLQAFLDDNRESMAASLKSYADIDYKGYEEAQVAALEIFPFKLKSAVNKDGRPESLDDWAFEQALIDTFESFEQGREYAARAVARRLALKTPDTDFAEMVAQVFGSE